MAVPSRLVAMGVNVITVRMRVRLIQVVMTMRPLDIAGCCVTHPQHSNQAR